MPKGGAMASTRTPLSSDEIQRWLHLHSDWHWRENSLCKEYVFSEYAAGVAFLIQIALWAEKQDHHPKLRLEYGNVGVVWSTHDARGVTLLDLTAAERCDDLFRRA